jgi:hypothetical protein
MSYAPVGIVAVGQADCAPCHFVYKEQCVPCPPGADLLECQGCGTERKQPSGWRRYGPEIAVGVVTAVLVTLASGWVLSRLQKK